MSQYLEAFEQLMVSMETSSKPMHAGSLEILRLPVGAPPGFVAKLVKNLRAVTPCAPFNKVLGGVGWNRWKTVQVNMNYHVRHVSLPSPGSMEQLMQMAEALYAPLLNRSLPLWEIWVIEGLEGRRFAIAFKGHHALSDGMKGMTTYLSSLSTNPADRRVRAPWGDNRDSSIHADTGTARTTPNRTAAKPIPAPTAASTSMTSTVRALWPLKTKPSRLNGTPQTSERRFGACSISLRSIKSAGIETGATVNDVLVALVDHATNRYLADLNERPASPLAVLMPISTRKEGSTKGASNQIVSVTAALGEPDAGIAERVNQVRDSLKRSKTAVFNLSPGLQMGYTVMLGTIMPNLVGPVAQMFASHSLLVSNITPPRGAHYVNRPLYRAGARLESYYIQPILNAGILLNVTVNCYDGSLNIGIGSVPGAINEPMRLGQYMSEALADLVSTPSQSARTASHRRGSTSSGKKTAVKEIAERRNHDHRSRRNAAVIAAAKTAAKRKRVSASG
jgi:diacylglycerol O-acyltransferase / wax synthase